MSGMAPPARCRRIFARASRKSPGRSRKHSFCIAERDFAAHSARISRLARSPMRRSSWSSCVTTWCCRGCSAMDRSGAGRTAHWERRRSASSTRPAGSLPRGSGARGVERDFAALVKVLKERTGARGRTLHAAASGAHGQTHGPNSPLAQAHARTRLAAAANACSHYIIRSPAGRLNSSPSSRRGTHVRLRDHRVRLHHIGHARMLTVFDLCSATCARAAEGHLRAQHHGHR